MYAAITLLKFAPGETSGQGEAAGEIFASLVMPAYAEQVARGAWIFTRPDEGRAIVIVLYESLEAAEVGEEKRALEEVMEAHGSVLAEPPRREVYCVAMGTVTGSPSSALAPLSGDILSLIEDVSRSL